MNRNIIRKKFCENFGYPSHTGESQPVASGNGIEKPCENVIFTNGRPHVATNVHAGVYYGMYESSTHSKVAKGRLQVRGHLCS